MVDYRSEDLIRFIEAAGESPNVDAKAPIAWDGAVHSASLTKDILALANTRDGGVLVIGKAEVSPGMFGPVGLTAAQAESFDTTKVATWVNNRCAPPVRLLSYRVQKDGKEFIVITVSEFDDVPVICTKDYDEPGKPKKLLKSGSLYIRTPNTESAPLSSVDQLRSLVGMATMKRADQMLALFRAMMEGRSLLSETSDEERWSSQLEAVKADLDKALGDRAALGRWTMWFHPSAYVEERWPEASELKKLIQQHSVQLRDEFPQVRYNYFVHEWGIGAQDYQDQFGFTRSGLFIANRTFREDSETYKSPWQPAPDLPPGKWFDYRWNIAQTIEFFAFMSRLCHEFEPGGEIVYEVNAAPLTDRRLVSMNHNDNFFRENVCRASRFRRGNTVTVESLRSNWESECARTLQRLYELFFEEEVSVSLFEKWISRFKDRTIFR